MDFKSGGREFKPRWGQTKIHLKKILPSGGFQFLVILNPYTVYFEVWMVVCFANYFLVKSIWAWCVGFMIYVGKNLELKLVADFVLETCAEKFET